MYKEQLITYNSRVKRLQNEEKILEELKPKSFIVKTYDDVFNAPKERLSSIKKSLEKPYTVEGFYVPSEKRLISFKRQEAYVKDIKEAFFFLSLCSIILIIVIISLIKIIRNHHIKLRLVKEQLHLNIIKQLT